MSVLEDLLHLSHEIGREDRGLTLFGEGNTSARLPDGHYLVKASGTALATLREEDVVECRSAAVLPLLERVSMSDNDIEQALLDARVKSNAKKPSVEAVLHAWALTLPGVDFAGHCHSVHVNQILCSPRARDFAEHRIFADEIVMCGRASVFVAAADPGLELAQSIRRETDAFIEKQGFQPKVILLEGHGIIALGATARAVFGTLMMAEKAAQVFVGAAQLGGPVFMSEQQIDRIATRPDELYRQRLLQS